MNVVFYLSSIVAIVATIMVITRRQAIHALLYLIVSLLAVAVVFFTLGAVFVAALEVIIYAGAIMVLFLFVIMMFNVGPAGERDAPKLPAASVWVGPAVLCGVLLIELVYAVASTGFETEQAGAVGAKQVGIALFGPYLLGVELASVLLLAGLVGAYHLGRREGSAEMPGPAQEERVAELKGRTL